VADPEDFSTPKGTDVNHFCDAHHNLLRMLGWYFTYVSGYVR